MSGFVRAFVKYLLNHALAIILILGMIVLIMGMTRALFPVKVVTVRRVTTADTVLKNVPVPTLKLVDRIVYKTVAPETVLVSQYHTDTLIREYCAAAADTNPKAARLFLTAGRYDGTTLALWGATTDERAYHSAYGLRPTFDWAVSGDSVAVHQTRLPGFRLSWGQSIASFLLGAAVATVVHHL